MFTKAPHPGWLPFYQETLEFLRYVILSIFGVLVALGDVQEKKSFGLLAIIGILYALAIKKSKENDKE